MTFLFETPELVAQRLARDFCNLANDFHRRNRIMHVALSGGTTPTRWFALLEEHYRSLIHWESIHFYWCDERMVPAENSESNYGEAKRILFDGISIPADNIHPIYGDREAPSELERYRHVLQTNLSPNDNRPAFDMVLLGMGEDGHTASLFPDRMDLVRSDELVEAVVHPLSRQQRITLTYNAINAARHIAFLITGARKATVLVKILHKIGTYRDYPAAHIYPVSGMLDFYLDKEAATGMH
jgi:6-phosphogluconolactonase